MRKVDKIGRAKEFVKFCLEYKTRLNKIKAQEERKKQGNSGQNQSSIKDTFDKIPFATFLDKAVEFSKSCTNPDPDTFEDFISFLIIYTLSVRTGVEMNWKYNEKKQKAEK